jgi:hypothetical protein
MHDNRSTGLRLLDSSWRSQLFPPSLLLPPPGRCVRPPAAHAGALGRAAARYGGRGSAQGLPGGQGGEGGRKRGKGRGRQAPRLPAGCQVPSALHPRRPLPIQRRTRVWTWSTPRATFGSGRGRARAGTRGCPPTGQAAGQGGVPRPPAAPDAQQPRPPPFPSPAPPCPSLPSHLLPPPPCAPAHGRLPLRATQVSTTRACCTLL